MIRVSICYPNEPGKKFDFEYWIKKHKPAIAQKLGPLGLVRMEGDRGIGSAQPGAPAPFVAIGHMYFNNMQDLQRCLAQAGELMADIPNYTDIQPQIQISEIMS